MPLCISCRGEYWVSSDGPPTRQQRPAPAASGLAAVYGLKDLPEFICARCHQSNQRWHAWATAGGLAHFRRFFGGFWGQQALFSFFLPLFAAVAIDFTPIASERIGIPLAILLIFVNVALLYALRLSLWRYDLLTRAGRGFRPPLALLSILTFFLALVYGLTIVFMLEARAAAGAVEPTTGLVRVATTILLALTFVNVTLSAIFMAAHDYGEWLNREMPQPIYAQERRLLGVIEDGLRQRIQQATQSTVGDIGGSVKGTVVNHDRLQEIVQEVSQEAIDDVKGADGKVLDQHLPEAIRAAADVVIRDTRLREGAGLDEEDLREKIEGEIQQVIQRAKDSDDLLVKIRQAIQQAVVKVIAVNVSVSDIERTADAGVIAALISETEMDRGSGEDALKQLQSWRITADRWGRIREMHPEGSLRYIVIETLPAENGAGTQEGRDAEENKSTVALTGELVPDVEETYQSRSETTVTIASRRQQWLE